MLLTQVTLEAGIWYVQNKAFRGDMPSASHAVCHVDQESRNRRAGAPMSYVEASSLHHGSGTQHGCASLSVPCHHNVLPFGRSPGGFSLSKAQGRNFTGVSIFHGRGSIARWQRTELLIPFDGVSSHVPSCMATLNQWQRLPREKCSR